MNAFTAYAATSFARLRERLGQPPVFQDPWGLKANEHAADRPVALHAAPVSASTAEPGHRTHDDAETADGSTIITVGVHQRIVLPLPARAHLLVCDGSVDVEYRPAALNWIPERPQDPGPVALSDGEHYECAEPGCVVVYGTGQHVAHVLIAQEPGRCRVALQWVQRVFRHRRAQYPSRSTSGSGQRPRV
ncbi:hypothetical protein [Robbsia sp. KACC 23696]|uniref:hypothetical protein n=1 Tax=Robbsia sp. KACC 23696 TaxID=3149231 RepID=UPI00325B5AD8